jgi:hypothetical protein
MIKLKKIKNKKNKIDFKNKIYKKIKIVIIK